MPKHFKTTICEYLVIVDGMHASGSFEDDECLLLYHWIREEWEDYLLWHTARTCKKKHVDKSYNALPSDHNAFSSSFCNLAVPPKRWRSFQRLFAGLKSEKTKKTKQKTPLFVLYRERLRKAKNIKHLPLQNSPCMHAIILNMLCSAYDMGSFWGSAKAISTLSDIVKNLI